jgi:hypothetical protein
LYQLAQLNIAKMRAPIDSPLLADFVANIPRINALAEAAPGFVWRPLEDPPPEVAERLFGAATLTNLSVWRDVDALSDYVHRSGHVEIMRRRREWFDRPAEAAVVLWWVPAGHHPTIEEAAEKLALLRRDGPTAVAFSFAARFNAPAGNRSPTTQSAQDSA